MIKTIALDKLIPSPRNVRRRTDAQADSQLKADIAGRGLLQNLVVTPVKKPRGHFAVEAGGRRLAALKALAEDGVIDASFEVPCLVIGGGMAATREASLAENVQRLAMNPADECLAFQQLIAEGSDVGAVARRFGLTVRFVEGRLRLADLAPCVFEALGAGEITLDVAKAFAATPDRERQAYVFAQCADSYMGHHPDSIRRMMTQATAGAGDRRARFVGEDSYVAAGGRIERDLFCKDDEARWLDVALLEQLASEKMAGIAEDLAAEHGFAFVRPTLDSWIGHSALDGLRRVRLAPPLTEDEAARVAVLEDALGEQIAFLEADELDQESRTQAETKIRDLDAELDAIVSKLPIIDPAMRASLGTFLLLGDDGRPKLDSAVYACVTDEDEQPASSNDETGGGVGKPAVPTLSRRLVDELAMQRRDILAAHVASNPAFALDLAAFLMADRAGYAVDTSGSSLHASPPSDPVLDFRTPETAAAIAREKASDALERSWAEGASRADRFEAFRALPESARMSWLGHAVAGTLEASIHLPGDRACIFHDHLGVTLGINIARWWRPTGANYFDRVPKSLALEALGDVGGPELAARHAKLKKAELSQSCERIFAGETIAEPAVKAAALAWVPKAMRFEGRTPETEDEADELAPWEDDPFDGEPVRVVCEHNPEPAAERKEGGSPVDDMPSSGEFEKAA